METNIEAAKTKLQEQHNHMTELNKLSEQASQGHEALAEREEDDYDTTNWTKEEEFFEAMEDEAIQPDLTAKLDEFKRQREELRGLYVVKRKRCEEKKKSR